MSDELPALPRWQSPHPLKKLLDGVHGRDSLRLGFYLEVALRYDWGSQYTAYRID